MTIDELRDLARKAFDNGSRCAAVHYDDYGNLTTCPDVVEMHKARTALLRRLPEVVKLCDSLIGVTTE